ncbi:MAG: hypothetical protein AAFN74_27845, partial [Myxococcota bacterium]
MTIHSTASSPHPSPNPYRLNLLNESAASSQISLAADPTKKTYVDDVLSDLRAGRTAMGLSKVQAPGFARASEADKETMVRAMVAQGIQRVGGTQEDSAQAISVALVMMDLVQNGTLPPDLFGGDHVQAFEQLINTLASDKTTADLVRRLPTLGVPPSIAHLANRHNLAHKSLSEAADAAFSGARIDPRYGVRIDRASPRSMLAAVASAPAAPSETPKPISELPAAVGSSLQMIQSIEIQLEAAVQTLN